MDAGEVPSSDVVSLTCKSPVSQDFGDVVGSHDLSDVVTMGSRDFGCQRHEISFGYQLCHQL